MKHETVTSTSSRHIRCDQNLLLASSKSANHRRSLVNGQLAAEQCNGVPLFGHLLTQPRRSPLRLTTETVCTASGWQNNEHQCQLLVKQYTWPMSVPRAMQLTTISSLFATDIMISLQSAQFPEVNLFFFASKDISWTILTFYSSFLGQTA